MVLCDGGFLLSTGVSVVMNVAGCVYQMNGEKELRQSMRTDIREEWREQRQFETKIKLEQEREAERLRLKALEQRYQLLLQHKRRRHRTTGRQRNESRYINRRTYYNSKDTALKSDSSSIPSLLDEELTEEDNWEGGEGFQNPQEASLY